MLAQLSYGKHQHDRRKTPSLGQRLCPMPTLLPHMPATCRGVRQSHRLQGTQTRLQLKPLVESQANPSGQGCSEDEVLRQVRSDRHAQALLWHNGGQANTGRYPLRPVRR